VGFDLTATLGSAVPDRPCRLDSVAVAAVFSLEFLPPILQRLVRSQPLRFGFGSRSSREFFVSPLRFFAPTVKSPGLSSPCADFVPHRLPASCFHPTVDSVARAPLPIHFPVFFMREAGSCRSARILSPPPVWSSLVRSDPFVQ
jgi:hypothetical protein